MKERCSHSESQLGTGLRFVVWWGQVSPKGCESQASSPACVTTERAQTLRGAACWKGVTEKAGTLSSSLSLLSGHSDQPRPSTLRVTMFSATWNPNTTDGIIQNHELEQTFLSSCLISGHKGVCTWLWLTGSLHVREQNNSHSGVTRQWLDPCIWGPLFR